MANDKSIVIVKADKVKSFCILDRKTYFDKGFEFLSNGDFKIVSENNDKKYDQLQRFLKKLQVSNQVTEAEMNKMRPSGNRMPIVYFLPKIHKKRSFYDLKLRPIVSFYYSFSYNLSRYLMEIIKLVLPEKQIYNLQDSFEFVDLICKTKLQNTNNKMYTLDIANLYPNLPVKIIIPQLAKDMTKFCKISEDNIVSLLSLCTTDSIFKFGHLKYKQTDGVTMGTPLAPLISEYFLRKLEEKFTVEHKEIKFYCRYVDDCFLLADISLNSLMIQNWFNILHGKLKFSIETEEENKISYLDILVTRTNTSFETSIFRKPVHPQLFQRYLSCFAPKYKRNLVSCMLTRAKRICSNNDNFQQQKQILFDMFLKSGYPKSFLIRQFRRRQKRLSSSSENKPDKNDNLRRNLYFGLSYCGKPTMQYIRRLRSNYEQLKLSSNSLRFYFKKGTPLQSIFSKGFREDSTAGCPGIYKIPCKDCDKVYIGETGRDIRIRVHEHELSIKRKFDPNKPSCSALVRHVAETGHEINFGEAKIIRVEEREYRRKLHEALLIKSNNVFVGNSPSVDLAMF